MESLTAAIGELGITSGWLNGEVVVMGSDGLPSFNALQNAFDKTGTETIEFFAFDLPYLDGKDLRSCHWVGVERCYVADSRPALRNAFASAKRSAVTAPAF